MNGPYASLEDACKPLLAKCAADASATCSCAALHPKIAAPKEPVHGVDMVLVKAPPGTDQTDVQRAYAALRTADGWWLDPQPAEVFGLWSSGMASACRSTLVRPVITASTWNGHDGWYFRIEHDITCWNRDPKLDVAPKPMRMGADSACAVTAKGPQCTGGGTGTIQTGALPTIESSFTSKPLP